MLPVNLYSTELMLDELGALFFHDQDLSLTRRQACASCHDPARAFVESRKATLEAAVSLGDDGISLGDRNTPTLTYAALTPAFHSKPGGEYTGGFFHDGRAMTLAVQAGEPFFNPREMALPGAEVLRERLSENTLYVDSLQSLFGEDIFDRKDDLLSAVTQSIAAFESRPEFAAFDSRYDRFLDGEYRMSKLEELGRKLFFSELINCNSCHLLNLSPGFRKETFTNYQYHNIGVPVNLRVRRENGLSEAYVDQGLMDNPAVGKNTERGKFKVPTLRNVAVTGPYMHNGVFRDLRTVLQFYNKYLVNNRLSRINPETQKTWRAAEVEENTSLELLEKGQPLDENFIAALEAFLLTLTDHRYEHLLSTKQHREEKKSAAAIPGFPRSGPP